MLWIYALIITYLLIGLVFSYFGKRLDGRTADWGEQTRWKHAFSWAFAWPWGVGRLGIYKALAG